MFHRLQSPLGSLTSQGSQSESRSETSQSNGRKAPLTPHSGLIVVFRSKRADRLKILLWDGTGLVLVYKRLGRDGRFEWPQISDGVMHLTRVQFEALFDHPC
ncbi:IS66 family insertion sequence element accessory protein TnpB [Bradyrhizobium diazoefficiens]|uniref:IS66 family insertion sequence element accessory protein TnpB n=1 Tax=Bradyrhizobium diazoefficiens TaxID=1355477 RepID=UPI00384D28B5